MALMAALPFGAVLTAQAARDIVPEDMRSMIARHRVLAIRGADKGDAALVDFLASLGLLTFTRGETPVPGAQWLNIVSNVGRTTPPRSVFHTDSSYVAQPPAFTAMRALLLPQSGGATLFSDQVRAYDRLPEAWKACLAKRDVAHRATGIAGETVETRHPLLRRHPLTGETALYLSTPERCHSLSGCAGDVSQRIITALYRHSIRAAHDYRHDWRPGDIVIWDNRVTMHRADHKDVVGDRILHRGMTMGEVPIMA
jgi:taurine dioxygenase